VSVRKLAWLFIALIFAAAPSARAQVAGPVPTNTKSFISIFGMNSHIDFGSTVYSNNPTAIANAMDYLGFNQLRQPLTSGYNTTAYNGLASRGLSLNIDMQNGDSDTVALMSGIDTFLTANPGKVVGIEGPNEIANWPVTFGGQTGVAGAVALQHDLFAKVRADSKTSTLPVVMLTLLMQASTSGAGDQSAYATWGNAHVYPQQANGGGVTPYTALTENIPYQVNTFTPSLPTVISEAGYYTSTANTYGVNQDVQARYMLDYMFDAAIMGLPKVYFYELFDNACDSGNTNSELHFGVFLCDTTTKKTAATAIHNLTTILADSGTASGSPMSFTVTGLPNSVMKIGLKKSNGATDVAVWAEPTIWDQATQTQSAGPARSVTVTFPSSVASVKTYDPMIGTAAQQNLTNVSSVTVTVTDHPIIIEAQPTAVVESADKTDIKTVGPQITDSGGNTWGISSGAKLTLNGSDISFTANVVEIAYVNHVVWQKNNLNDWYSMGVSSGAAVTLSGPTQSSPLVGAKAVVPAPLTGTVTTNAWVAYDSTYSGITLPSGKPFHYVLAQPPQYDANAYKYPLYIWLHPDHSGDSWYTGDNNPLKQANNEAANFNTVAFQTRHPAFYVAPSADQTDGSGNQADSAIENWGGWFNNGTVGSGTHFSGDTGPNTFALLQMISEIESRFSIDTQRIYVNGFSLGGIFSDYGCYHYNAYTGDKGKIFAACTGSAGVNEADGTPGAATANTMRNVPQWQFSGANDTSSKPGDWNSPLCSALGGTPSNLTGITSASANQCGTSAMRYTLCPTCGHQNSDANGNPVWSNQIINDFIFSVSSGVAEVISINTISGVSANQPFTVAGSISGVSTVPTLQYQVNGAGAWNALPSGSTVSTTGFSFTAPGMAANTSATISVRDATSLVTVVSAAFTVSAGNGKFTISGGKVIDPQGNTFVAHGVNVDDGALQYALQDAQARPLTTFFPHINFIRVPIRPLTNVGTSSATYADPSTYDAFVKRATDNHIVVEFEDHSSNGGQWENFISGPQAGQPSYPPTGAALTTMLNYWIAMANRYKTNPYVWFGSLNEINSGDGTYSTSAIAATTTYEDALYKAIRTTAGANNIIQMGNGVGGGNCGTVGTGSGQQTSLISQWTGITWYMHGYYDNNSTAPNSGYTTADAYLKGGTGPMCGGSGGAGYTGAQTLKSADGVVPVIYDEWGPASGNQNSTDASQLVAAIDKVQGQGVGSSGWSWYTSDQWHMVNNGFQTTNQSLSVWGQEVADFIAKWPAPPVGSTESLTINTIATVAQNTTFVVSGTIAGVSSAPSLQYQDNGGTWTALPAGSTVSATAFSFTHPGMAVNTAAKVAVRDANNTAISATGPPFIVKGAESANNTVATPTTATSTPNFGDTFSSLSLHRTWQSGDKWQLVAPDTPDGRGGPNFGESGTQWWVNHLNPSTPISGIYTTGGGLQLGLIATPSGQASYINSQAGATMPYVGGLLNSSQTSYQKYGYWEFSGVTVPRIPGVSFQADLENVQITGTWPPEIDLRIYTDGSNVQTVLMQTALGGGQYAQYTKSSSDGFDATVAHTYGIDWQSTGIKFYIDNVLVQTQALPSTAYSTDPMFMFLLSASNYISTVNPSTGSLPTHATVGAVNVYATKPGGAGPSAIITDADGNTFQILADATISINGGAVSTVSSNVIELAYVNHVVWQENSAGNWYSYTGSGGWSGPTTTSPITGTAAETLAVNSIPQQTTGFGFTVSGTIVNATTAPSLQYQDNGGTWVAFPTGSTVSTTTFSFNHPGMAVLGANTVSVRDANQTSVTASSNSFSVVASTGEAISVSSVANQLVGQTFTVSGTIANAPASSAFTNWWENPGQDGSYWKQPFQSSANWITSGSLVDTLRSGTPSINLKGNYGQAWYIGRSTDPLVTVTQGSKSIQVHLPLGAVVETPTSGVDQTIGGVDVSKPYLAWSISGSGINTGSVAASGSVITGTYGLTVEDGAGLFMVDAVTGVLGSLNAGGGINDTELEKIEADASYVIPHMLAYQLDISQASSAGPIWPLNQIDGGATYTGPIPQGTTIGIPASTPRPTGKSRGFYALWDQMQQFGGLNYNFGNVGGVNLTIYDADGTHNTLVNDMTASWPEVAKSLAILNYANGVSGAQYSLATTKGAIPGSTNAFTAPPPLDLSPTGGVNVAPSTFGAWYPNTSYTATPTNPGVQSGVPTLEYQDNSGAWNALPAGATVTATTFSFTHPSMAATSSGVISVRDKAHPTVVGASNTFSVTSAAVETLTINSIAQQTAGVGFAMGGTGANVPSSLGLQYSDNGGAWTNLPTGSTVVTGTTATFSFSHPAMSAKASNTVSVRDAASTSITASSNAFAVLLAESGNNSVVTTVGPQIVDASGEAFTLNASQQVLVNGTIDTTASAAVALAYVNHTVWYENTGKLWFSKTSAAAAWSTPGTLTSPLPPETLNISTIGDQTVGVDFSISGGISSALVAPSLQYAVSSGPWVAFPSGSQITTTSWSLTVPGISTVGQATIAVRDAGTTSITTTSNSFAVAAAPVESLAIATILSQTQNTAFRVTGTIVNATTIPTLQYAVNGGAWLALPTGSPASLVTQTSFAFTVPGIATPGITTISVRDANQPTITAVSNSFQVGAVVGESLSLQTIPTQFAATSFVVTGSIANAPSVPVLQYAISGGAFQALPSGATVTQTGFSFTVPGQPVGSASISVRDAANTAITAQSNTFQIQAVGTEALTVSTISDQSVGLSFSIGGTIRNVTAAPSLQYQDNGGTWQSFPAGATVTTTNWSFLHPGLGASQSMVVAVRDAAHTNISASAPAFAVLARESPNLTTVTTVGPQIVDASGNVFTLTQGKQVAVNGVADTTTSQVIETAYVNRQVWYENASLLWRSRSAAGIWSPSGGTLSGPLPSSKVNLYLTNTARIAVVRGFTVAIPGVIVNDTIANANLDTTVTSTMGTVSMPGASGSGTSRVHAVGTLAATNQALRGLLFTGTTVGQGVVSIVVTDGASRAAANVNIAVVRAAPVIPPGR
jgi:hypothetical protein